MKGITQDRPPVQRQMCKKELFLLGWSSSYEVLSEVQTGVYWAGPGMLPSVKDALKKNLGIIWELFLLWGGVFPIPKTKDSP